jgi:hypothetical protein
MIFNISFDSSVSGAPSGFVSTVNAVAQFFQNAYSDNVTVNINVGFGEIAGQTVTALGQSLTFLNSYTYTQVRNALVGDAKTADDSTAINTLPSSSPLAGATYWVAQAEAKALGLLGASGSTDGSVGFSSSANIFDYDRSDGISAGQYDFYGVVAHEFTEVMGRQLLVGQTFGGHANSLEPMDLFHYSAPGSQTFIGTQAGYFSLDGGNTNLDNFNTISGGDFGDWASSAGNDAFNAFGNSGAINAITEADLRVMDTIGWDRVNSPPPPPTPPPPGPLVANGTPSDFNLDFMSDILWRTSGGSLAIWEMNGTQIKTADYFHQGSTVVGAPGPDWHVVETGALPSDFDGDGKGDVLWRTDGGSLAIWEMNGTQIKFADYIRSGSAKVGAPGADWHVVVSGDFDADGKADLLWRTDGGALAIWEMNGTQIKTADYIKQGSATVGAPGADWHLLGADDFDGDGKGDLLWRTDSGALAIWEMNGTQIKAADYLKQGSTVVGTPGADWHIAGTGDFDGDGHSDILWRTNSGALAIWEMNGTQIKAADYIRMGPGTVGAPGPDWHIYATGDFDGDGHDDLLWKTDGGALAVWKMNGTQITAADYLKIGSANVGAPGADWTILSHHYDIL